MEVDYSEINIVSKDKERILKINQKLMEFLNNNLIEDEDKSVSKF